MDRKKLIEKVKALLAKTIENGCTEHEAGAAIAKAHAMMDSYEISEDELELTKKERAILANAGKRDPHLIKRALAAAIAEFTGTRCWLSDRTVVNYCGLQADVDFALWLTDSLASFVQAELCKFLAQGGASRGSRRIQINGFVLGCASRIGGRLVSLARESKGKAVAEPSRNALTVVRTSAIDEFLAERGIKFSGRPRRASRKCDLGAYQAGQSAGDRANFGRPVGGECRTPLLA